VQKRPGMTNNLEALEVSALHQVTGGKDAPQPKPQKADETKWIKNTIKCTKIGGPLLGAACGILTPTPAN
jgi:hypothetical protein